MRSTTEIDVVGRYRVVREVGKGGFSTVYLAFDRDRPVAVKVFDPAVGTTYAQESFTRERDALERLDGLPGVVDLLDTGTTDDGRAYIVLPFLARGSLADLVGTTGPLPVGLALDIAIATADALAGAHAVEVLHRDIKPSNVFFGDDGVAMLADFGLSSTGRFDEVTFSGSWATPAYVAPETVNGSPSTPVSDVYSLAATIHFMLMGTPPFPDRTSVYELMAAVRDEPAPRLDRLDVPAELADMIESALSKDPAARPGTAAELATDLREVRDEYGFAADPLPARLTAPLEPETPPRRSRRPIAAAAILSVLGLMGVVVAGFAITAVADEPDDTLQTDTPPSASGPSTTSTTVAGVTNVDPLLADRSPALTRILDDIQGAPAIGSRPGLDFEFPEHKGKNTPATFDDSYVSPVVQHDCPNRTLLRLHLTGARMRTWFLPGDGPLPREGIVVGLRTFASEEDAHGHFTGVSLQFGLAPGECTEPDGNVERATFAGSEAVHRDFELDDVDFPIDGVAWDEWNTWQAQSRDPVGYEEQVAFARAGRTIVLVRFLVPPGDERRPDVRSLLASVADSAATHLTPEELGRD